jgi:hypothetical protein
MIDGCSPGRSNASLAQARRFGIKKHSHLFEIRGDFLLAADTCLTEEEAGDCLPGQFKPSTEPSPTGALDQDWRVLAPRPESL